MATGALQVMGLSSSPPLLPDHSHSPSNMSSPLSDVEDKDGDVDDMDLDLGPVDSGRLRSLNQEEHRQVSTSLVASLSDVGSKVSEMDVNESEAETERIYDSPHKNAGAGDMIGNNATIERQFIHCRDETFEASPSKLQNRILVFAEEKHGSEDESLSDADPQDIEDTSLPSSQPDPGCADHPTTRSPLPNKTTAREHAAAESNIVQDGWQDSTENRKRKRSSLAGNFGSEQPLWKRSGSKSAHDANSVAENAVSKNTRCGEHMAEEDNHDNSQRVLSDKEEAAPSIEEDVPEPIRPRKSKRGNKKRKSRSPDAGDDGEPPHGDADDVDGTSAENAAHADADHDEEAEATHKEELERKKAAWEELMAIEKQFGNFRERLYKERLEELNREEAMLMSDNPTHPEYLAMTRPVDERRDERIRVSGVEYQYKLSVLRKRAVAERAQAMSQFAQSVRDSREKAIEQLGKEWYEIQSERRRTVDICDYGLPFSSARAKNVRNAIAYSKEVSILSGFAKHVGFPAAPTIQGASEDQIEADLEAIHQTRHVEEAPFNTAPAQAFHRQAIANTVSEFGRGLGPLGEQFIEQTPWANPNHPAHHVHRQQEPHGAHESTASSRRQTSHPTSALFPSRAALVNGDSAHLMQKSYSSAEHDTIKTSKLGPEQLLGMKRETVTSAF